MTARSALENPVLSVHRASQMVVEPHAPEAGVASRDGTSQHFVNANAERIEQQVDLHAPSMSEPTCGVPLIGRSWEGLERTRCVVRERSAATQCPAGSFLPAGDAP